jgi:hypothetical protein
LAPLEAALGDTEGVGKVDETPQTLGLEISCQKTKFMVFSLNNQYFYKKNEGKRGRRTMMTTCPLKRETVLFIIQKRFNF